ncbi:MAG: MoaD/ThiS family protein [Lysobacteraceae bacterium]
MMAVPWAPAGSVDSTWRDVLDEHGRIRHHVAVFIDGESIRSKSDLDVSLNEGSEVYIMQALSGG